MREIKFRAEKKKGGYVYLDLRDLLSGGENSCIFINNASEVKLETLAQLVGYDKDGNEVYEGDSFDVQFSNEEATRHYVAELLPQATAENGCIFYDYHFKRNSIKEVNYNA